MHNSDQEANKRSNHPTVWSAYQPMNEGKAIWEGPSGLASAKSLPLQWPQHRYLDN